MKTRVRISTTHIGTKIFLIVCLVFLFINLLTNVNFELNELLPYFILIFIILFLFLLTSKSKTIIYNKSDCSLEIYRKKMLLEKITIDKIEKFQFSILSFSVNNYNDYTYKIFYKNINNEICSIRIHPRLFRNDISEIIKKTKEINKKVEVCNWSFGFKEFFKD